MIKIRVYKDSMYPYYGLTSNNNTYEPELEITEEEYKYIMEAEIGYKKAQAILARAYERRDNDGNRNSS